jgi:hypothetical protein
MALYNERRQGLDQLAALEPGTPVGDFQILSGPLYYRLVHYALAPDAPARRVPEQGPRLRGEREEREFQERIEGVLAAAGGFALQRLVLRYGVWACPFDQAAASGLDAARILWNQLVAAGQPPPSSHPRPGAPGVALDWRCGDALYIHYPDDGGMACTGAVVPAHAVAPPNW